MINIEKEFYKLVEEQFADQKSIAFHFAQYGVMNIRQMEKYLIRKDFERMTTSQPTRTQTSIREELSEKYYKSTHQIRVIVERV